MMTFSHRSDQSPLRGRSPQHDDAACDLSTPEVLFRSLPRAGARDIHLISFGFKGARVQAPKNLPSSHGLYMKFTALPARACSRPSSAAMKRLHQKLGDPTIRRRYRRYFSSSPFDEAVLIPQHKLSGPHELS